MLTDVLSKGQWILRGGQATESFNGVDWAKLQKFKPQFKLDDSDFTFLSTTGIQMLSDVITKVYETELDLSKSIIRFSYECFLVLLDRHGKWRVNTVMKSFADNLIGFASSYSNMGDVLLIEWDWQVLKRAFDEMKRYL
ncbi:hypothetical protein CSV79_12330 [Sporosarcina sp. P13]|uniref:hypothetical protein n=1 Tax=Sporosarcina sp. P13 TaxID=2048263 RepID=UPI000C166041|nr:hypothetical protein [Sporosarcina sp. P13]PIC63343.1 hypothetical protein CSV79_12330 [Sporosarcina sp. P13]